MKHFCSLLVRSVRGENMSLASIGENPEYRDSPEGLRGPGVTFITVGLMSLGFMSFSGMQL